MEQPIVAESRDDEAWACAEALCVARSMARRGLRGEIGDPLPDLISQRAYDWIMAHLDEWRRAIAYHRDGIEAERSKWITL